LVVFFLIMALVGPWLAPFGSTEQISGAARQPPSVEHLFGTDRLGRDVFSRIVFGARDIFALAGVGTLFAVVLGTVTGLLATYAGRWWEEIVFRIFDSLLALPALLLALLLLGTVGPSRNSVLIVLVIVYTPIVARVVRSVVLDVKTKGYIESAHMQGETMSYILFREIFPAVLPALAVEAALRFSYAIFLVASLGFLGVGVQPPSPDWGLMVNEARNYLALTPWALYFPAAAISLLVIGVNLMADGLKRALQAA
jgi:peptide/nickel transport system permease protein